MFTCTTHASICVWLLYYDLVGIRKNVLCNVFGCELFFMGEASELQDSHAGGGSVHFPPEPTITSFKTELINTTNISSTVYQRKQCTTTSRSWRLMPSGRFSVEGGKLQVKPCVLKYLITPLNVSTLAS
jgi:hypothetical protein